MNRALGLALLLVIAVVVAVLVAIDREPAPRPALSPAAVPFRGPEPVMAGGVEQDGSVEAAQSVAAAAPKPEAAGEPVRSLELVVPEGVVLPREEGTLVVRVRSLEDGTPMHRARVVLASHGHAGLLEGEIGSIDTDVEGRAEFSVPLGVPLRAVAWARRAGNREVRPHGRGEAEIPALDSSDPVEVLIEVVTEPIRFVGRVVDAETGGPLADSLVVWTDWTSSWICMDGEISREQAEAIDVDAEGYFEFERGPWETGHFEITADGHGLATTVLNRGFETRAAAMIVPLDPAGTVAVVVLGEGGPVERAEVILEIRFGSRLARVPSGVLGLSPSLFHAFTWKGLTGSDGRCAIGDLPADILLGVSHVAAPGAARVHAPPIQLARGERRELVLRLAGGATVRGTIADAANGSPQALEVWLKPSLPAYEGQFGVNDGDDARRVLTDAHGAFEFEHVPDGAWWVGISPGGAYPPLAQVVHVADGAADRAVRFEVERGLRLSGVVLGPSERPVQGALVSIHAGGIRGIEPSDMEGHFSFGPLPAGLAEVSASGHQVGLARSVPVEAQVGDDAVVLRLRPGGEIRGRLVDASKGEPRQGEVILMVLTGGEYQGILHAQARESGQFVFRGLEPGTYRLIGTTLDGRTGTRDDLSVSMEGETPIVALEAEPGAILCLRCEDSGSRVRYRLLSEGVLFKSGLWWHGGAVARHVVPPGNLRIEYEEDSSEAPQVHELSLIAGEEREIVLGRGGE